MVFLGLVLDGIDTGSALLERLVELCHPHLQVGIGTRVLACLALPAQFLVSLVMPLGLLVLGRTSPLPSSSSSAHVRRAL